MKSPKQKPNIHAGVPICYHNKLLRSPISCETLQIHHPPFSSLSPFYSLLSLPWCACRKSYEFEDLLQSSGESSRVDWYAQAKLTLTRTLSEENVYEDILGNAPSVLLTQKPRVEWHGGKWEPGSYTHTSDDKFNSVPLYNAAQCVVNSSTMCS